MMPFQPLSTPPRTSSLYDISEQQTLTNGILSGEPEVVPAPIPVDGGGESELTLESTAALLKKRYRSWALPVVLLVALTGGIFWLWRPATAMPASPPVLPTVSATAENTSDASTASNADGSNIQVYITGAVAHPGVYTLSSQARVYQLLQAAGGPLPGANLTALNLATHLSDGQEIYVLHANETPVTGGSGASTTTTTISTPGDKVNVNTASADELRQGLQISSTSAQKIVTYRLQHGPYVSVDTLSQVLSKTVYTKIKGMVTIA